MHKVDNNRKFCVYRHTSPSGKCYIGITCQNPIKRWGNGKGYYSKIKKSGKYSQPYFVHAIEKYGWDNFNHEILFTNLGELQAKLLEISLIRFYKNQDLSYNITDGGDGVLGVHHTSWNKGLKMPEEKIRRGYHLTKEHKEKLSIAHKGKAVWPPARPINLYTADGQYLDTFERCSDLARYLNASPSNVNQVCLHNYASIQGMQVRYVDDNTPLLNMDYYTKLTSDPVELIDEITGNIYIFPTVYCASRYTTIPQCYLIKAASKQVPKTHNVICRFLTNNRRGKKSRKCNKNNNE